VRRRQLLSAGVGLLAVAAAGCTDDAEPTDDTDATDGAGTETPGGDASTADPTATSTDTADLDLREANVTGVGVEEREDGYPFSVTLFHDDEGEDGYANWWVAESLDGTELGQRLAEEVVSLARVAERADRPEEHEGRGRRESEQLTAHGRVDGSERLRVEAIGDHLDPTVPEDGALGGTVGEPRTRRRDRQVGAVYRPLLPAEREPRRVPGVTAVEFRAVPTGVAVPVALPGVVTAAGKRPHVGESPHDRAVERIDRGGAHEAAGDPVQVDDVRVERVDATVESVREPVDRELAGRVVRPEREAVQDRPEARQDLAGLALRTENRGVVGRLAADEHPGRDVDRS